MKIPNPVSPAMIETRNDKWAGFVYGADRVKYQVTGQHDTQVDAIMAIVEAGFVPNETCDHIYCEEINKIETFQKK